MHASPRPSAPHAAVRPSRRPSRRPSAALLALLAPGVALAADRPVELRFAGEFAGVPFDCAADYADVGAAGTTVGVTDYRLFVSNVALVAADGTEVPVALEQDDLWQSGRVALLDFEDGAGRCDNGTPETRTVVRGTVPEGEYAGVAFDLGVPFEANHGDPTLAGSPLNLTAMFWNWQGGYRFLKLDTVALAGSGTGTAEGDATHGAATGTSARDGAMHGEPTDAAESSAGDGAAKGHAGHGGGGHGGAVGAWMLHVGSSGCASASRTSAPASPGDCARPNRPRVALDGFDPDADAIAVDPAAALAASDLGANAPGTAPGCMSGPDDPDCAAVMPRLGITRDGAAADQRLFAVRRDAP